MLYRMKVSIQQPMCYTLLLAGSLCVAVTGWTQSPEAVLAGFEQRIDTVFRARAGKQLKRERKRPPLAPGRGNYVRAYSFSIVEFAARCFYLGEMLEEANAALAENAQHYLDNPKDINDRDSFHWHADIVMRLIEMYGTNGTKHAGRLTRETEELCLKPIWEYARNCSWLGKADYKNSKTWGIYGSENHHAMDFTVNWQFAKIAKDRPEYKERKLDDGATVAQHYRAWNDYFVVYCRERARKGPCVEMMCPGYNSVWLKGFYNFYDFGDERVSRSAGMLIDLYFAYWAQEHIDGVTGGGKSRVRGMKGFAPTRHGIPSLAALYFGIGELPDTLLGNLNAALSDYRPPAVVADIAISARNDGPYEVLQRAQGLGVQRKTHHTASGVKQPSTLGTDGGGILRYSYCDPAFTIGTLMTEARPFEDWVNISTQARWQGVIFAGQPSARIVPIVVQAKKGRDVLNGQWAVQSKGSLLTQKLKYNKGGGEMIVWMPREGVTAPIREDDVVFVEAEGAHAAVRVIGSEFRITTDSLTTRSAEGSIRTAPPGIVIIPRDDFAPVVVEVMAKDKVSDFDDFKRKVKGCTVKMQGAVVDCETIYGDRLTLDTSYREKPTINGKVVDYAPSKVLESPFLNADYNSGVVTISRGTRKKVLDFRARPGNEDAAGTSTERKAFEQAAIGDWKEIFFDSGTGDWKGKWFLDGEVGAVKTGPNGMTLTAGDEFKNDAHHVVLWTKRRFEGDVKIEYDYTRLDKASCCVNILYIQATGSGEGPYAKDISAWRELRKVPAMRSYYDNMNTYHISYATFPKPYIRGRRYLPHAKGLKGTELDPDYFPDGLFATGVTHHITVIKKDRELFMRVENSDQVYHCQITNRGLPVVTEGRIGLRHMFTRSARYQDFRVSTPDRDEKDDPRE
jgi:hypothetical protein